MAVRRMARCLAALVVAGLTWGTLPTHSSHAQDVGTLDAQFTALLQAGKYAEAARVGKRMLGMAEKELGREHPTVGQMLTGLAFIYQLQGSNAEAAPLYKRSLPILERSLGPGHHDVGQTLGKLADAYRDLKRYAEAEPLYKRSLTILERTRGPQHQEVAVSLNNLGLLYYAQLRHAEAEPLYMRSLAILEKVAPGGLETGAALHNLATVYQAQGRAAESVPLFQRAIAIRERGLDRDHPDVSASVNNLALSYAMLGRYAEAEAAYKRSLAMRERRQGPDHPDTGLALSNLADHYRARARYAEAEPLYKRGLAVLQKALGSEDPGVAVVLNNLASQYWTQDRYADAEPLYQRSLAIREKVLGADHPDVGQSLNNLATLYDKVGRFAEAEPLYKRNVAIVEKTLGPDHPYVATPLFNLAEGYRRQGRIAEAERLLKRCLAIWEKTGEDTVAAALSGLALIYQGQQRYAEAEALYQRSLAVREKMGLGHPDVGLVLSQLGDLYRAHGRHVEAETVYRRALSNLEAAVGSDHPVVGQSLHKLALLAVAQNDWHKAADYWARSIGVIKRRAERGVAVFRGESSGGEAARSSEQFRGLVKAIYRLAGQRPDATQTAEMFEVAQSAQASNAAASLAQMAARSAKGSPRLAGLVREQQDLVGEWQAKDKLLVAAKSSPPAKRDAKGESALVDRLADIDKRLAEIDRQLARDFPDYATLASPAPLSLLEAQAQLRPDEALVLLLDTDEGFKPLPEETFVWVVTRQDVRWLRSGLGTAALAREVAALRCGLDASAWNGNGAERCASVLGRSPMKEAPGDLPFDTVRAHRLYLDLFGDVQDLIEGKHLLIVPSGALTQLPFHVLVTEAPAADRRSWSEAVARFFGSGTRIRMTGGATAWLARSHAVTVLPAVSSLKALRRVGRPSAAPKAMIGFGNPLLDGRPDDPDDTRRAKLARASQRCTEAPRQHADAHIAGRGRVSSLRALGGLADVAHLRMQVPLPETADELCAVAADLKVDVRDIRLGAQATEREVKRVSASGQLAQYRVVHFATHGALAGELEGTHEPGLVLTPPESASEEDDGYLSASEIAALKLDANLVILSACNTAAGAANSAEALSGLARAFIYAGARALLVSHWAVDSNATVRLVTVAVAEMARDPGVGRAEAMRRAMLALIQSEAQEAHPSYWAPFVVVGEGAAR